MNGLIGIGVYTPAEAGRLLRIRSSKIIRWLKGHEMKGKAYDRLWDSEVSLGDERVFLGFRDLMEVRVVNAFIREGVSAIRVRAAIQLAREIIGQHHPLSTNRFRTDGREIFLNVIETDETGAQRERLLNLFNRQYAFREVLDPVLKTVDFNDDGNPALWWPGGRRLNVVVDPERAFGAPIDAATSVPTAVLAGAASQEGIAAAARIYDVPEASVRRAVEFETGLEQRLAA